MRLSARRYASRFIHHTVGWIGGQKNKPGAFLHGMAGFVRMVYHRVRHHLRHPLSFWQDKASLRVLRAFAACVAGGAALVIVLTAVGSLPKSVPDSLVGNLQTGVTNTVDGATFATAARAISIPADTKISVSEFSPPQEPTLKPESQNASPPEAVLGTQPMLDMRNWPESGEATRLVGQSHAGGPERRGTLATMSSLDLEEGLRDSISEGSAYNESEEAPLADVAHQVDAALLQTLARLNLDASALNLLHSETRFTEDNLVYPFLRLRVNWQDKPASMPENERQDGRLSVSLDAQLLRSQSKEFAKALGEALTVWAPAARLHHEGDGLLFIAVDRFVTHSIVLPHGPNDVPTNVQNMDRLAAHVSNPELPTLVIVIDDMGEDLKAARTLLNLPFPVTFSVWPRSRWASYVATLAHEKGRQVFLHQPMQPVQAGENMGQGGLRVTMTASEVASILRSNLRLVPNVTGINNHMGSRFTSARSAVRLFCQHLREIRPDIVVLDSLTHGASVLYDEALAQGFFAFRRALFLDDVRGKDAILKELDHGMELARRNGQAIVIGHPRPDTLAALLAWQGYLARDVAIVPLAPRPDNTNGGFSATNTELP